MEKLWDLKVQLCLTIVCRRLNSIFSRKYVVLLSTFEKMLFFLSKHNIDVKENITVQHDVSKNENTKMLHSRNTENSANSVHNMFFLNYHAEIISKLMRVCY